MSYDYIEEEDIGRVMVRSAITNTATFQFPEGEVSGLEMRAFTLDGQEHHLIWPIQAALPLLEAVMHVSMKVLGAPDVMGDINTDVDDIGDIENIINGDDHD